MEERSKLERKLPLPNGRGLDRTNYNFHMLDKVTSTNTYLKNLPSSSKIEVCCAEQQTEGRGRFGRKWESPYGKNIYLSIRIKLPGPLSRYYSLALVVAMAVLHALQENIGMESKNIVIKWPNDILWKNKKLCGILIETALETPDYCELIIGIGLNVNQIDPTYGSLLEITGVFQDKNRLIVNLLKALELYLERFQLKGFGAFLEEWDSLDYLKEQWITVTQAQKTLSGIASGVNVDGQLCLKDKDGLRYYLSSGETSLSRYEPSRDR